MKKIFAVIAVIALAGFALNASRADAVPACVPRDERFGLTPLTATYNGERGSPATAGTAVYSTDAGVQFYVGLGGELAVVPVTGATMCPAPADEVTVTLTDPWTGEVRTFSVRATP